MKSGSGFWSFVTTSGAAAALRVSCASPARLLCVSRAFLSAPSPHHHAHIAPQDPDSVHRDETARGGTGVRESRGGGFYAYGSAAQVGSPGCDACPAPPCTFSHTRARTRALDQARRSRSGKKASILHPETRLCVCVPLDRGWLIGESSRAHLRSSSPPFHTPIVGSPLAAPLAHPHAQNSPSL